MRTGAAAGHRGCFHETALYGSDDEFLSIVVPFLEEALQAGEPAVVALGEANAQLIRAEVKDASGLSFADGDGYTRPASTIRTLRELLAQHVTTGAHQIRVVGEIPRPGVDTPWEWWARYEAAVNHVYDDFPMWGLCAYDTRSTPAQVLADVASTHPYSASADGHHGANPRYEDPIRFLTRRPLADGDPLEAAPPVTELVDPAPAVARHAVRNASATTALDQTEVDDLVFAVSEAVTNGICHGRPPVRLRLYTAADRVVATVTDHGPGPINPFVGLLPTADSSSAGLGLWMAHQMCSHVTLGQTAEGFTIRFVAGTPAL